MSFDEKRRKLLLNKFPERKVYVVLGAGRSGTSFISKALHEQGVDMGKDYFVTTADYYDKQQVLYENTDFEAMNKELIKKAKGDWRNPPDEELLRQVGVEHRDRLKKLIEKHQSEYWGWKDPRTSMTAGAYLPLVDTYEDDVYLVCVFRKPDKVARSLERWHGMKKESGVLLAREYARRILGTVRKFMGI